MRFSVWNSSTSGIALDAANNGSRTITLRFIYCTRYGDTEIYLLWELVWRFALHWLAEVQ